MCRAQTAKHCSFPRNMEKYILNSLSLFFLLFLLGRLLIVRAFSPLLTQKQFERLSAVLMHLSTLQSINKQPQQRHNCDLIAWDRRSTEWMRQVWLRRWSLRSLNHLWNVHKQHVKVTWLYLKLYLLVIYTPLQMFSLWMFLSSHQSMSSLFSMLISANTLDLTNQSMHYLHNEARSCGTRGKTFHSVTIKTRSSFHFYWQKWNLSRLIRGKQQPWAQIRFLSKLSYSSAKQTRCRVFSCTPGVADNW